MVLLIFLRKHTIGSNLQVLWIAVTTAKDTFNKAVLGLHKDQADFNNPFPATIGELSSKHSESSPWQRKMTYAFLRAVLEYLLFMTPDIYELWKIWWKIIVAGLSKFPCQLLASLQCFLFYILVTHSTLNRGLFHKSPNYAWSTSVKHWRNWLDRQPKFSRDTKLTEEVLKETD